MLALALGFWRVSAAELRVPEMEAKRAAVAKPNPELSPMARQLKLSGHVELTVKIDASGSVADVQIVSGSPVLTAPCVAAVKKWKFKPFTLGDEPASAVTTLSFEFKQ